MYQRFRASYSGKDDIHTRLMRKYKDIPEWWFYLLLAVTVGISLIMCIALKEQVQLPWWGLLFACGIAFIFTLPIAIITATTNQVHIVSSFPFVPLESILIYRKRNTLDTEACPFQRCLGIYMDSVCNHL